MKIEVGKYYRLFQTSPYSRTLIGKAVSVGVQTNYGLGSVFDLVEDGYKWKVPNDFLSNNNWHCTSKIEELTNEEVVQYFLET